MLHGIFAELIQSLIQSIGVSAKYEYAFEAFSLFIFIVLFCSLAYFVAKKIILTIIERIVKKTKVDWDDVLMEKKVFRKLSLLAPAVVIESFALYAIDPESRLPDLLTRLNLTYIIIVIQMVLIAVYNALQVILQRNEKLRDKPIDSFIQLAKVITYIICFILILSALMDRNPTYFLSAMGAMTAIILLIFKDTILGLVASVQLAVNDMVRVNDWVVMQKYSADGNVIEINLHTIKVQNWDKTITTIPTYAFISESFTNWRGMEESDGRRIKRSLHVNMNSVQFCTPEMIERFRRFKLIEEYLLSKEKEIEEYNTSHKVDRSEIINGRNQTNLGVFRHYIEYYLRNNPFLNQEMTFLVRQLQPTAQGLPIEIYVFSKDQAWVNYENIQADIFDHLLAVVSHFELELFQYPSGNEVKSLPIHE